MKNYIYVIQKRHKNVFRFVQNAASRQDGRKGVKTVARVHHQANAFTSNESQLPLQNG